MNYDELVEKIRKIYEENPLYYSYGFYPTPESVARAIEDINSRINTMNSTSANMQDLMDTIKKVNVTFNSPKLKATPGWYAGGLSGISLEERKEKRRKNKAQRQARKKNRK